MNVLDNSAVLAAIVIGSVIVMSFLVMCLFGRCIRRKRAQHKEAKLPFKPCPPIPSDRHNPRPNRINHVPYDEARHGDYLVDETFLYGDLRHIRRWAVGNNYPANAITLIAVPETNEFLHVVYIFYRVEVDESLIPASQVDELNRRGAPNYQLTPLPDRRTWRPTILPFNMGNRRHRKQRTSITAPQPQPPEGSAFTPELESGLAVPAPVVTSFQLPSPALAMPVPETSDAITSPPPVYTQDETPAREPVRNVSPTESPPHQVVSQNLTPVAPQSQGPARVSRFIEHFDHETDPADLAKYL